MPTSGAITESPSKSTERFTNISKASVPSVLNLSFGLRMPSLSITAI